MNDTRLRGAGRAARLVGVACLGGAVLLLARIPPAPCRGEGAGEKDPLPLRRLVLPADRLAGELKRVGVLVRLPGAEFEALVRAAARGRAGRRVPRLVEARYRASLVDLALSGTAQWKVSHPGTGPALLDLQPGGQPFNLALKQPRFENRDALLAEFDGRSLALLVERPGEHTVAVDWSARAEARPEGLQVDLRIPTCPVASLELSLPADRELSSLDGALLSGPHPAESTARRLWKVVCGGRGQVQLLIRRGPGAGQPLILARQKTTQRLDAEGLEATYAFTLEVLHQGVRELVCECDPALRPTEVQVPHLDTWSVSPGAKPGVPARLTVRLREPLREGTLVVRCLAPLANALPPRAAPGRPAAKGKSAKPGRPPALPDGAAVSWVSPGVRLTRAVPRGETLELWLHPGLRVDNWQPGAFRLADLAHPDEGGERGGLQRLTLVGGGGELAHPAGKRPALLLHAGGVEFRARQLAWWQIAQPGAMSLALEVRYEVSQGQLFALPLLLPAGWEVEAVTASAGILRNWTVRPFRGQTLLAADLRSPLRAGGRAVLAVRLRPARPGPVTGRDLPFPDAVPLGARFREGALAVSVEGQVYQSALRTAALPAEPEADGPWGKQIPEHYFPYRGEPVSGTLRLEARPPRLRARCAGAVYVAAGRAALEARLTLEAEGGSPDAVELCLPAGAGELPWKWEVVEGTGGDGLARRVRGVERLTAVEVAAALAGLAGRDPLQQLVLQGQRPRGQRWRVTLDRPLAVGRPLTLRALHELEPKAGEGGRPRWEVPLPAVRGPRGTTPLEGEVTLHLAGTDLVRVEAVGLREGPLGGQAGAGGRPAVRRTFRYTQEASLALQAQATGSGRAADAAIEQAALTTYAGPAGLQHHFSFRVTSWPQRALPLRLPPGARLLAVAVNGHWLERLATPAEGEELELPVPAPQTANGPPAAAEGASAADRFEVVYATDGALPFGAPWARLEAPAPVLPAPPARFQRRWRLRPGLRPLSDAEFLCRPGPGASDSAPAGRRQPGDLFRLLAPWAAPARPDGRDQRRQALADAAASLRGGRAGKVLPLRAAVAEVAFGYLKERHPLVVDAVALREAGVGPRTPLTVKPTASADDRALPWEECGLVALAARPAVLLTSRRQAELWGFDEAGADLPPALEHALAQAVAHGHDPSGRFRSALSWPEGAAAPGVAGPGELLAVGGGPSGWTEWEPVAGEDGAELVVVRDDLVAGGGLAVAAALGLVLWALGRRPGGRLPFLFVWLALAGVGLLWLPAGLQDLAWWPLLVGAVAGFVRYVRWAGRRGGSAPAAEGSGASPPARRGPHPAVVAGGGAALVLLALAVAAGRGAGAAGAEEPATVYLVPGPAGAPERDTVLAPPALLARLRELARPAFGPRTGAVLVSASYEGKLVRGLAEFDAVFQVHALADAAATLALPLEGVQLQGDVLLDGARAHPVALPAPRAGYALKVRGKGRHKVELRFRVPVAPRGEARQVRFGAPRLVQSRLVLRLPAGASHPQALVKHGGQRVVAEGPGQRLEVELGAVAVPVQLSWHQDASPPRKPHVVFREAYLWELRDDASSLRALLHYTIDPGAVPSLTVDLPPELEVRSAEAHRGRDPSRRPKGPAREAGEEPGVRLRDWAVTGSGPGRALRLEFPAPVSGEVEVALELVPRVALVGSVVLPVPRPHGEPRPDTFSYLAYRTDNRIEAERKDWLQVTGIDAADFAPFWPAETRPEAAALSYASTFRRQSGSPPVLRVQLRPPAPRLSAEQDVRVRVGRRQAEVTATVKLTAPGGGLSLVEWEVRSAQPLTVAGVSGSAVRRWSQTGDRILVWLKRTAREAELELTGWLPVVAPGGKPRPGGAEVSQLDLPCLRVLSAERATTRVRLTAGPGLVLRPVELHELTALGGGQSVGPDLAYRAGQWPYRGRFLVQAGAAPAVRVLTAVTADKGRLTFTATVDWRLPRAGRPGPLELSVRLRRWEGDGVRLVAPPGGVTRWRQQHRRSWPAGGRERTWALELKPGASKHYRLTLTGSMPLAEAAGALAPDVTAGGVSAERLLVLGSGLDAEAPSGLAALGEADLAAALKDWPGAARVGPHDPAGRHEGRAWKVAAGDWRLRLVPRDLPGRSAPAHVLLGEQAAAVVDGRRWLHEAVYWLWQAGPTDLTVTWPDGAEAVGVTVDGAEAVALQAGPGKSLSVPLSGRAGSRRVRLRWRYAPQGEALDRPRLEAPVLAGARGGPLLWTVHVPPGWEVQRPAGAEALGFGPARTAALELARASAHLEVSRLLAEQQREGAGMGEELAKAQRHFAWACRRAEQALELRADRGLGERLRGLRERNRELAARHQFEAARGGEGPGAAAEAGRGAELAGRGTPLSWQAGPDGEAPKVRLEPSAGRRARAAAAVSGQWLGLLVLTWAVSLSALLRGLARWLWPEQVALVGLLGWHLAGPTLVVLVLIALACGGRLLALTAGVRALLRRGPARPALGNAAQRA